MVDEHKKYVDRLLKLQDKEGKDLAEAFLSIFGSMAKASKGNARKFLGMLKVSKKKLLRDAIIMVRESQQKARQLGKEFGMVKIDAIKAETSQ